ncbi:hypothetical protein BDV06DRAFT_159884 [Aspergillus oleicola]
MLSWVSWLSAIFCNRTQVHRVPRTRPYKGGDSSGEKKVRDVRKAKTIQKCNDRSSNLSLRNAIYKSDNVALVTTHHVVRSTPSTRHSARALFDTQLSLTVRASAVRRRYIVCTYAWLQPRISSQGENKKLRQGLLKTWTSSRGEPYTSNDRRLTILVWDR